MTGSIRGIRAIRAVGDRAVLVELDSLADVLGLQARLQEDPIDGQLDVLAAATTVLVTAVSAAAARGFAAELRGRDVTRAPHPDTTHVLIDTVYDGEDLALVAAETGLSQDGVIAAHTGQTWTAAFGGFAPGFVYLTGETPALVVPRRAEPRSAVPAGSVALAGDYSAVYPRASPGGWQLIGRTDARMWDLDRARPALVRPGNRVRFRAVREFVVAASDSTGAAVAATEGEPSHGILVVSPGLQTTVQDLGRPGFADLGVASSGALDRGALRRANHIVGNPATAAVLENALGGLVLTAETDQVLAVTGAPVSLTVTAPGVTQGVTPGGTPGAAPVRREPPMDAPISLLAGETLTLGSPRAGVRSYLAFRGGIDVPLVLGSRSADTMSGIGPAPLVAGDRLRMLPAAPGSAVHGPETPPAPPAEVTVLRFVPGPRADWFDAASVTRLAEDEWAVSAQSNRIGLRLDGEPLVRSRPGELASEGTVKGAVQVPPSGLPVLFLADHPVTGGYPVIGVVLAEDLDLAAQLPTGARIRFDPAPGAAPSIVPIPATES